MAIHCLFFYLTLKNCVCFCCLHSVFYCIYSFFHLFIYSNPGEWHNRKCLATKKKKKRRRGLWPFRLLFAPVKMKRSFYLQTKEFKGIRERTSFLWLLTGKSFTARFLLNMTLQPPLLTVSLVYCQTIKHISSIMTIMLLIIIILIIIIRMISLLCEHRTESNSIHIKE